MNYLLRSTILVVALILSAKSFSAELKLTSFGRIDTSKTNLSAEVCGVLTGAPAANYVINIKVDYTTNAPGYYHATTGKDGQFCEIVATVAGVVEATIDVQNLNLKSSTTLR